ncbi:MAG: ArsC/Spx/MgsR family protein [Bacteroidia bacterium]
MRKIFFLSSCSTCQRIIKELDLAADNFIFQDIKNEKISPAQLDQLKELSGSYEALFSRTAMKYKALNLKEKALSEKEYRNYILEEYTFLKRPVIVVDNRIFIGNAKQTIAAVKAIL